MSHKDGPAVDAAALPDAVTTGSSRSQRGLDLRQDARWAAQGALSSVLGTRYLPRALRAAVLRRAGARTESPPGIGFQLVGNPRNLAIGRGCYFNQQVFVEVVGPITIGEDCAFGMQSMLVTSHHPIGDGGRWDGLSVGLPISIGDRVWIGARATILPGAVIEDDVVIAASAVVAGHCAAWGLYAGVPARRIRELRRAAGA